MAAFVPLLVGAAGSGGAAAGGAAAAGTAAAGTAAAGTAGLFGSAGAFTLGQTAATLSAAAGVGSAVAAGQAGAAAKQQATVEAQQTKVQANQASLERREEAIRALALQNAKVGAGGITQAGTPSQVKMQDIKQYKGEQKTADVLSRVAGTQIRKKGSTAKKAGMTQAGISLLSTGADYFGNA